MAGLSQVEVVQSHGEAPPSTKPHLPGGPHTLQNKKLQPVTAPQCWGLLHAWITACKWRALWKHRKYANIRQSRNISILERFALILSKPSSSDVFPPPGKLLGLSPALKHCLCPYTCQEGMNLISIPISFRFSIKNGDVCKGNPLPISDPGPPGSAGWIFI